MSARRRLAGIMHAWMLHEDIDVLHELIIDWTKEYKHLIKNQDLVTEILNRVDTEELVKDFVYGGIYTPIRLQFLIEK